MLLHLKIELLCIAALLTTQACRKNSEIIAPPAAVNIINAIPNSNSIIPVFGTSDSIQYFANANSISFGNSWVYSPQGGSDYLYIVQYPDTVINGHSSEMFNGTLKLLSGGMYSFFLAGSDTSQVDTAWVRDNIPYYRSQDSLMGARFVNLSKGSLPIRVTLQSDTLHTPLTSDLAYKSISPFEQLPANAAAQLNGYTFEFRDATTDSILMTIQYTVIPAKSITVCLIGQPGASATVPQSAMIYNNY